MANLAPRPAWQRGLAALLIFVLAFLFTMVVGYIISFTVMYDLLGYDMFPWAPNPAPDWLGTTFFWAVVGISLMLASFLGWKLGTPAMSLRRSCPRARAPLGRE